MLQETPPRLWSSFALKSFFSDLFSSSSNLRKWKPWAFLLFPTCKRVIDVKLQSDACSWRSSLKKLKARLIFVVLVFEYLLVWMYFMWSEDLWPDSFVTVTPDWFLCGCAPREGAISGLRWLLRGVTCLKSDWLYCSSPCHSASVPVPTPDLQGS